MAEEFLAQNSDATREVIYQPLDKERKEIRILHVKGRWSVSSYLNCNLEIVSLLNDPKPQYEAISYCWGEVSGYETILLNGQHFRAPRSAVKVLQRIRPPNPNGIFNPWQPSEYQRSL